MSSNQPIDTTIPEDIRLFVSAKGTAAGTGTEQAPFLTIERAFEELSSKGWNKTATIVVLASGGPLELPQQREHVQGWNAGSKGRQQVLPVITGSGRSRSDPFVVTEVLMADSVSGLIAIRAAGTPFSDSTVGQIVTFTTGPMLQTQGFPGTNPGVASLFVAEVVNGNTLVLPYAGYRIVSFLQTTLPTVGDQFVLETLDSEIVVNNVSEIVLNRDIAMRDLRFNMKAFVVPALGFGFSVFLNISNFNIFMSGLHFTATPNAYCEFETLYGQNLCGDYRLDTNGVTTSTLGAFYDARATGSTFNLNSLETTQHSSRYAQSVFLGNSQILNMNLSQCYFNGGDFLRNFLVSLELRNVWARNCKSQSFDAYLVIEDNSVSQLEKVHIEGSAKRGITVQRGGSLSFSNSAVSQSRQSGIVAIGTTVAIDGQSMLTNNGLAGIANDQSGLLLTDGANGVIQQAAVSNNARAIGSGGIDVRNASRLSMDKVTGTGNFGPGVIAKSGSTVIVGPDVTVTGNQSDVKVGDNQATRWARIRLGLSDDVSDVRDSTSGRNPTQMVSVLPRA